MFGAELLTTIRPVMQGGGGTPPSSSATLYDASVSKSMSPIAWWDTVLRRSGQSTGILLGQDGNGTQTTFRAAPNNGLVSIADGTTTLAQVSQGNAYQAVGWTDIGPNAITASQGHRFFLCTGSGSYPNINGMPALNDLDNYGSLIANIPSGMDASDLFIAILLNNTNDSHHNMLTFIGSGGANWYWNSRNPSDGKMAFYCNQSLQGQGGQVPAGPVLLTASWVGNTLSLGINGTTQATGTVDARNGSGVLTIGDYNNEGNGTSGSMSAVVVAKGTATSGTDWRPGLIAQLKQDAGIS